MEGTLVTGEGSGHAFVDAVADELTALLGFRPFPGTLNVTGVRDHDRLPSRTLDESGDDSCGGAEVRPCRIGGVRAAIVRPLVPDYPTETVELLAPVGLRALFDLSEGERIALSRPDTVRPSWTPEVTPTSLDQFDAVVFDLDGTLVDLRVDWSRVFDDVRSLMGVHLERPVREYGYNELFDVARDAGVYDEVDALVRSYEREGAKDATGRPPIEVVDRLDCRLGICTANAVEAARIALERFDLEDAFDVVVGRDSLSRQKPDPAVLRRCFDAMNVRSGDAAFVGDEDVDAETAGRAETSFIASDRLSVSGPAPPSSSG